ncbi:MAG: YfhO family protein, partial [Anaerolineae bacterium]
HDQVSDPESSASSRRAGFVALAVVVALILLAGHTQTAFIALVGLGVYGLGPLLWRGLRRGEWRPLVRDGALLGSVAILGMALAAVQLVPTWELSRLSVRARGLPFNERVSFSLSPLYVGRALLPRFARPVPPEHIEHVAYVGVAGLALALAGCVADPRRRRGRGSSRRVDPQFTDLPVYLLTFVGLFFAFGLYNPLYLFLARVVPGFAHFRVPARWLALYVLGVGALAGRAVQSLWGRRELGRGGVMVVVAALSILVFWGVVGPSLDGGDSPMPLSIVGWAGGILVATGALILAARVPRMVIVVMLALLVAELLLASAALPHVRATAPQAFTSMRPAIAHLLASQLPDSGPAGRFLSMSDTTFDPGDFPLISTIYGPQLSADQLYAYVVATKQKEIVSPNLPLAFGVPAVDGYGGGVLPLGRYVTLQSLFLSGEEVSFDGRLRENLSVIPDGRWLNLFNVHHVITDKLGDAWIGDIFYDLQFGARLSRGDEAAVGHVPPFEATAVGLISHLEEGAALPDGALVGVVTLGFEDGDVRQFELRAGEDVAEGTDGGGYGPDVATRLRWGEPARPVTVSVQAMLPQSTWVVRGMSLIDERTGNFQSLVISDRGRFRLAHSGDVKIYENLDVLPRAFIVHQVQWASDDAAALAAMQDAAFDPSTQAVLNASSCSPGASNLMHAAGVEQGIRGGAPRWESASITEYRAERVVIEAHLDEPGILLLTDAAYPGWRATVDGEPVSICRADLLFRTVTLEPGDHRVVFAFRPLGQWVGGAVSGIGLVVLLIVSRFVFHRAR